MKNIVITILIMAVLILSGYIVYDKFIYDNNQKTEKKVQIEENNSNEMLEEKSECQQDNNIKYYANDDSTIFLTLLPEFKVSVNSTKGLNEINKKEFILEVGHGYSADYLYGNYTIENDTIKLQVNSGCDFIDGMFKCELPDATDIVYNNSGMTIITLNYSEDKIVIGNTELNMIKK